MQPETTDKITADTNIEVDRLIYKNSYAMIAGVVDPNFYDLPTTDIASLRTAGSFSMIPYFGWLNTGGNRIYKGVYFMPVIPHSQSSFSNYIDTATVRVLAQTYAVTPPNQGWKLCILVKSINVKL